MASALALRYSTNWAMKTSLEAGQFLEFILTGKKKMKQKTLPDSYDFISAGKRDLERLSVL